MPGSWKTFVMEPKIWSFPVDDQAVNTKVDKFSENMNALIISSEKVEQTKSYYEAVKVDLESKSAKFSSKIYTLNEKISAKKVQRSPQTPRLAANQILPTVSEVQ